MMRFEKTTDDEKVIIELHEHATIDQAIDAFGRFLRACGYTIPYSEILEFVSRD